MFRRIRQKLSERRGMTMVELILAIALMAALMVVISSIVVSTINRQNENKRDNDLLDRAREITREVEDIMKMSGDLTLRDPSAEYIASGSALRPQVGDFQGKVGQSATSYTLNNAKSYYFFVGEQNPIEGYQTGLYYVRKTSEGAGQAKFSRENYFNDADIPVSDMTFNLSGEKLNILTINLTLINTHDGTLYPYAHSFNMPNLTHNKKANTGEGGWVDVNELDFTLTCRHGYELDKREFRFNTGLDTDAVLSGSAHSGGSAGCGYALTQNDFIRDISQWRFYAFGIEFRDNEFDPIN